MIGNIARVELASDINMVIRKINFITGNTIFSKNYKDNIIIF